MRSIVGALGRIWILSRSHDQNGNEQIIGIGETPEQAWKNAALELDKRLFRVYEVVGILTDG